MLFQLLVASLLYLSVEADFTSDKIYYSLERAETYFVNFLATYNKTYESEAEYYRRYFIFKKNLNEINDLNQKYESATFGVNSLSDLTAEEWSARLNYRAGFDDGGALYKDEAPAQYDGVEIPTNFDWRAHDAVTPVKNQGPCGSCWAFATVGAIESQVAIKHEKMVDLSEQQLVDCDSNGRGCYGGYLDQAARYAMQYGMMREADYRYKNQRGWWCLYNRNEVVVKVTQLNKRDYPTESEMAQLLVSNGPSAIYIYVSDEIKHYRRGVLTPRDCGRGTNHAVLLVGYGIEYGTPYWLIKNSWGTDWGEDGYFKILRGMRLCGVNTIIVQVQVE